MKKYIAALMALCAVFILTACTSNNAPANPSATPSVSASPDTIPGVDEGGASTDGAGTNGGGTGGVGTNGGTGTEGTPNGMGSAANEAGNTMENAAGAVGDAIGDAAGAVGGAVSGAVNGAISGFEEGKQVNESDVPEVTKAVKGKYANAKITGITMSTHEGNQVYHVMLEGAADTTDIYVDAQGNITPYVNGTGTAMS